MAYKILINSKGVPVLVEVPEKPEGDCIKGYTADGGKTYAYSYAIASQQYEQALSTALSDESKHIPFKDELSAIALLIENNRKSFFGGEYVIREWCRSKIGQTFDLPPNVSVIFEEEQYIGSETENSFTIGYKKLAILTPKENSAHSFTEGEASEQKPLNDLCQGCMGTGVDAHGQRCLNCKGTGGSVVTQSEKGEMIEEIWEKIIYTQHVESGDEAYIIEKDDFIKAMQEYSIHSKQQARVEAIQECIEAIKENFQWLQAGGWSKAEICQVLETLKSRQ